MLPLTNPVRDYAWGSHRRLAAFLGREPAGGPEAELWIGAHEDDPSTLPDGRTLDAVIAADPVGMLGTRVATRHANRLPFLMKVLAVDEPLSLQVHPDAARARIGFEREERAGVPHDAAERSYKDPWHKAELIYALTRFEGMAGFRDVEGSAALLSLLGTTWSEQVVRRLPVGNPAQALAGVVTDLLASDPTQVAETLATLVEATAAALARLHALPRAPSTTRSRSRDAGQEVRREAIRVFELLPNLVERYPDDPGVLVSLLLNHVVLAPGEALFVGAGVVHAYTSGLGVEIMAASDNVLRAGLTPKHRDAAGLLAVTDFAPIPPPRCLPKGGVDGLRRFAPPVGDFVLDVATGPGSLPATDGPAIAIALDDCEVHTTATTRLARGSAVYLPPPTAVALDAGSIARGSVPR